MKRVFTVGIFILVGLFSINPLQATEVDHVWDITYPHDIPDKMIKEQLGEYIRDVHHDIPLKREHQLEDFIVRYSKKQDIDPFLVGAFGGVEADFVNQRSEIWHKVPVYNEKGEIVEYELVRELACGYFQVKPSTYQEVMGYPTTCENLIIDVEHSVQAGIRYIAKKVKERGSNAGANGIGAYNAGPEDGKWNFGYLWKIIREYKTVRTKYKPEH
jgi:hypothetical protein